MMRLTPSDYVDAKGIAHKTLGDNIRHGARGAEVGCNRAVVHLVLDNGTYTPTIISTDYEGSNLTVEASSGELYLTDSTADVINIVESKIYSISTMTGGNFNLYKQCVNDMSGALICGFVNNATSFDITLELYFKAGEI